MNEAQPNIPHNSIQIKFPFIEGNLPKYANAVITNPDAGGGIVIEFGFFDQSLVAEMQTQEGRIPEGQIFITQSVSRVIVNPQLAQFLIEQLQTALKQLNINRG